MSQETCPKCGAEWPLDDYMGACGSAMLGGEVVQSVLCRTRVQRNELHRLLVAIENLWRNYPGRCTEAEGEEHIDAMEELLGNIPALGSANGGQA